MLPLRATFPSWEEEQQEAPSVLCHMFVAVVFAHSSRLWSRGARSLGPRGAVVALLLCHPEPLGQECSGAQPLCSVLCTQGNVFSTPLNFVNRFMSVLGVTEILLSNVA